MNKMMINYLYRGEFIFISTSISSIIIILLIVNICDTLVVARFRCCRRPRNNLFIRYRL
jgi:hypothetical protein